MRSSRRRSPASTSSWRSLGKLVKALLVIPAYNEAENIERVVDEIAADYPRYDYIVVNDGSKDETADICRKRGYNLLDLPVNLGLAGAFQTGVKYALMHGYDCVVQFDADGQHLPEYLDSMVDALEGADIVLGCRAFEEDKPTGMRMVGSKLLSGMIRVTTGKRIVDPTSGMRAYNARAMNELAFGPNLGPEPDTIAYLMKRKGLKVAEVPVRMAERIAGTSYLNWSSSSAYMFRMTVSVMFIQLFR